jgi:hypothetical protein
MPDDTYQVCGCEGEMGYHVVIRCTKAWALRQEMRHHWQLPDEEQFKYSGPDWLLHFLSSVASEVKARIVLLLWHAWDLRNDVVHAKGMATIMGSANFLVSYEESINTVTRPLADQHDVKGKGRMKDGGGPAKTTKQGTNIRQRRERCGHHRLLAGLK